MHGACMATKTISLDLEAYGKLSLARVHERESFSQVIKRALWPHQEKNAANLLEQLDMLPRASAECIDLLEANQRLDLPPTDSWHAQG